MMTLCNARRRGMAVLFLPLVLASGIAHQLAAQTVPPPPAPTEQARLTAVVDSVAAAALRDGPLAGLSIAVARGSEVLIARGYGYADLENDVLATPQTVYRIGSVTKQFGAAAILQLVDHGLVRLDDDISKYFHGWPTNGRRITIEHLLRHTGGIKNYSTSLKCAICPFFRRLDLTTDEMLGVFRDEPTEFAPGDRYSYSNSGYFMLGAIVERVTGLSFAEYVQRHLFEPLGMTGSSLCYLPPIIRHRARGYAVVDGAFRNSDITTMHNPGAAGALCSTVLDLVTWTRALHSDRVVGQDSYRRMIAEGLLNDGSKTGYGYGLQLGELDGQRFIAHGGSISGFRAQLSYYPEANLIVSVLTNTEVGVAEVARAIARAALAKPVKTSGH